MIVPVELPEAYPGIFRQVKAVLLEEGTHAGVPLHNCYLPGLAILANCDTGSAISLTRCSLSEEVAPVNDRPAVFVDPGRKFPYNIMESHSPQRRPRKKRLSS